MLRMSRDAAEDVPVQRHARSHVRTLLGGVLGALAAVATLVAVVVLAWHVFTAGSPRCCAISGSEFSSVSFDQTRDHLMKRFGHPETAALAYPFASTETSPVDMGAPPTGSLCDYYGESNALQDPGTMRFCFADGKLVEKTAYDMFGNDGNNVCRWRSGAAPAECFFKPPVPRAR